MEFGDWVGPIVFVALTVAGSIAGLRDARRFHGPVVRKRDTDTTGSAQAPR
ncbi:hypothetical protein GCM10010413_10170 [Promicromonospora sukumoe]